MYLQSDGSVVADLQPAMADLQPAMAALQSGTCHGIPAMAALQSSSDAMKNGPEATKFRLIKNLRVR